MRNKILTVLAAVLLLTLGARAGVDPQYFDLSVKPQDDFFRYINGTWLKTVVMPSDQSRWGSFTELQQRNWANLHGICDQVSAPGGNRTPTERLVGDFYASGMNDAAINAAGAAPLQSELDHIAAMQSPGDVMRTLARLSLIGVRAGFNFSGAADEKDSNTVLAQLDQGGLGLAISDLSRDADRDYYFNSDEKSKALRWLWAKAKAEWDLLPGNHSSKRRANDDRNYARAQYRDAKRLPIRLPL